MSVNEVQQSSPALLDSVVGGGSRLRTFVAVVLLIAALSCSLFIVWSLNRQLDFAQEGMYLLQYTWANQTLQFAPFLKVIPHMVQQEIIHYRLLYLLAIIVQSTILASGVFTWATAQRLIEYSKSVFLLFWSVTLIGSSLALSIFPQTIGYNGFTTFFLDTATGLLFFSLSSESNKRLWAAFLGGCAVTLAVFPKFSSCLLFIAITSVLCLLWRRNRLKQLCIFLSGICFCAIASFLFLDGVANWLHDFPKLATVLTHGTHGSNLFAYTLNSCGKHILELLSIPLIVLSCFWLRKGAVGRESLDRSRNKLVLIVFGIALTAVVLLLIQRGKLYHSSILYVPLVCSLSLAAIAIRKNLLFETRMQLSDFAFGSMLLLSLPFTTSLGTSTPFFWHMIGNFGPFFLCSVFAAEHLYTAAGLSPIVPGVTALSCAVVGLAQFYLIFGPMVSSPRMTATITVPARLSGIVVEPDVKEFLQKGSEILSAHGLHEGDEVLFLSGVPILVYGVGAKSPCTPLYDFDPNEEGTSVQALKSLGRELSSPLFLVVCNKERSRKLAPRLKESLKDAGLNFPEDFEAIGELPLVPQINWGFGYPAYFYRWTKPAQSGATDHF